MNTITWISQNELAALGWTLLHFCWQGTAIAVLYAIADRLTSRATSPVRYVVALTALALMPLAVTATFVDELHVTQQSAVLHVAAPEASIPTVSNLPVQRAILQEIALSADPALTPSLTAGAARLSRDSALLAIYADHALPWIDAMWVFGVLLLALRAGGGWWQLEQVRRRALVAVSPELDRVFRRIHQQLRVGQTVALRISGDVISPLAMGLWRTTVILPFSAVMRLSADEVEAILAHELGHIRRCDYAVNLIQTAVESVLFFHPAVWRLSRTVRERREICCDEIAVQCCSDPVIYAQALLRMEEQRTVSLQAAVALEGCGGSLLQRIRKVLGERDAMENFELNETRMASGVRVAAAGAVMIALLLGPRISTAGASPRPDVQAQTPSIPTPMRPAAPVAAVLPVTPLPRVVAVPQDVVSPTPVAVQAVPATPAVPVAPAAVPRTGIAAPVDLDSPVTHIEIAPLPEPAPRPDIKDLKLKDKDLKIKDEELKHLDTKIRISNANLKIDTANLNRAVAEIHLNTRAIMMMDAGLQNPDGKPSASGTAYLDAMRNAGYPLDLNNDLNSLVALKSLGVTPEYATSMNNIGLGKPTAHELISLKAMGVTPEYVASLKQQGVTPLTVHDVISMKAQKISPEYITWFKQHFPQADQGQMRRASIFHIDDKFLAQAKAHGFDDKDLNKLLRLKISGLLDD